MLALASVSEGASVLLLLLPPPAFVRSANRIPPG